MRRSGRASDSASALPSLRPPAPAAGSPGPDGHPGSPTHICGRGQTGARGIVVALRADQLTHVGLRQRPHDLQSRTHGQRQQAFSHILTSWAISAIATLTCSGIAGAKRPRADSGYSSSRRSRCCRSSWRNARHLPHDRPRAGEPPPQLLGQPGQFPNLGRFLNRTGRTPARRAAQPTRGRAGRCGVHLDGGGFGHGAILHIQVGTAQKRPEQRPAPPAMT